MAFGFGFGMPRSFAVPPFSPASLFANGEQGWWYDPSNLSTLFQDSAGTTPVTAMEQPVGLQLDLSKGLVLGSQLISNPGPFINTTGYAVTAGGGGAIAAVGGELEATSTGAGILVSTSITTIVGKTYSFSVTARNGTYSGATIGPATTNTATPSPITTLTSGTNATYPLVFTATQTTTFINIRFPTITAGTAYFTNISVRELPGNHRFQTTSANRPVVSARVNLLTKTEDFSDAVWTKSNATITANSAVAPNGTTTADTLTATANLAHTLQAFTAVVGVSYTPSVYIKRRTGTGTIRMWNAAGTTVDVTSSVTSEWNQITVPSVAATSTGAFFFLQLSVSGDAIDIWGADLRVSNVGVNLPAYQRVNTSTDYNSTGFPIYIKPNGSNQFMQTNSINFSATDKMTVWQGARKLSDAAIGVLAELGVNSESTNGTFGSIPTQSAGVARSYLQLFKTARAVVSYQNAAPTTYVETGAYDIGGATASDEIKPRLNGAVAPNQVVEIAGPAGTGNFGTYPAYFYMRGGISLPFNGHDYGSIARGAASTAAQITAGENYINSKTKAFA